MDGSAVLELIKEWIRYGWEIVMTDYRKVWGCYSKVECKWFRNSSEVVREWLRQVPQIIE